MEAYVDYQIHRLNPELRMAFDDLRLHYPPYLKMTDATVYHLQKPVVTISSAKIRPGGALFFNEGTIVAFQGSIQEGRFKGKLHRNGDDGSNKETTQFEIELDGILLEDLDGIRNLPNIGLTGQVRGKIFHVDKMEELDQGQVDLIFTDCLAELEDVPFNIKRLRFSRIDLGLVVNGSIVEIKRLEMTGSQADAQFNGQLNIKQPINQTRLNIKGNVRLHAEFMTRLKKEIPAPLWPSKNTIKSGIPITVSGTMDNPRFGMR